ncbi:MAG: ABC transporter ATP-binding protein [Peptococcaceae bacterium]|nr:ABC transporter ATP-binding protein [Peptococcaceae bacterium]
MIRFEKVSFTYQEAMQRGSLRDIDLIIHRGECVLLCGRSGCGKTTLTRLVNGLIPYFYPGEMSGTTYVDGKAVQDLPMYDISEYVGSVFQNPRSQFFNVDTDSEISFGMENLTYPKEKMQERLSKTVAELDIAHLTGRSIFELSGGEKQKVAFASIYAMSPDIYLLDEPSSNLDMDAIEDLRRTLELLKKQGKTILIAEHRMYYLRDLVDRVVYMENGAIAAVFSRNQFLSIPTEQRHSMGLRALDLSRVQPRAVTKNSQKPMLEVRHLSLFHKKRLVLDDLNLRAAPGDIIGIIGHNGAGKSTFSRTICGLHTNCTGQILWHEKALNAKSRLKHSYMVMQDVGYQLFADTLEKECVFGIKHPDLDAAKQAMEWLGIYEHRAHHPNTLSGGQKQRAAVAVSMVCRKDVLIFDEPTSGLDYDSMIQVAGLLQRLSKMGKVIFVVTHDYEFLAAACTRVIHLDDGKQQEDYPLLPDNLHRLQNFFLQK